jgi:tetratricopeptide (TPR) repeat protein
MGRVLAVALVLVAAVDAHAQPNGNDVESARQHFRRGNTLFDLQRYAEAAHEYEAAYEGKDDPALLFNIGQAYRLAGEYSKAIGSYKAYLRRSTRPRNRPEVEARIADLQRLLAEQRRTQDEPPTGPEPVPETPMAPHPTDDAAASSAAAATSAPAAAATPAATATVDDPAVGRKKRLLGLGVGAGGVAVTAVGAALVGLAYATQHTFNSPGMNTAWDPSAASRMRNEQIAGGVLLGIGAGAIVGGVTLYLLGRHERHARVAVAPFVGDRAAGLFVAGVVR